MFSLILCSVCFAQIDCSVCYAQLVLLNLLSSNCEHFLLVERFVLRL